jgi:hypothetical protein
MGSEPSAPMSGKEKPFPAVRARHFCPGGTRRTSASTLRVLLCAQARVASRLNDALQTLQSTLASEGANVANNDAQLETLRHTLEDQKTRLTNLLGEFSGTAPADSISIASSNLYRVAITETLQRPVAIGFRAARRTLNTEDPHGTQ